MRNLIRLGGLAATLAAIVCTLAGAAMAHTLTAPTITAFAPNHGVVGAKVTIYGHNLAGAQVQFNGTQAANVKVDPTGTHLTAYVPPETTTGPGAITVITPGGTVVSTAQFTVTATGSSKTARYGLLRPRIGAVMPTSGRSGTKVTITGVHLGGAIWVTFGGVRATFTVPATTRIVATVPPKAHTGRITVHTADGSGTALKQFVVLASSGT